MNILSGLENVNETLSTHYLIYKITNNINEKYYIGQHKTNDIYDDYMGSGSIIKLAEKKYDLSNFTKTILYDFDNFDDMNKKEQELVQLSNCWPNDKLSYNLRAGGNKEQNEISIQKNIETQKRNGKTKGYNNPMYGKSLKDYMSETDYITWKQKVCQSNKKRAKDSKWLKQMSKVTTGKNNPMYGHSCTEYMSEDKIKQWKENISKVTKGINNPMYGKSSWEKCSDEERIKRIEKFKASMKGKNKGKRCMKLPNETHWKYVKPEDIQKYLDMGYQFYSQQKRKKFTLNN